MKTRTMVAAMLALALAAGCKKKEKDNAGQTGTTPPVTPKPNEGAAPTPPPPPPEPPKATPKTGKDLAQVFLDCTSLLNAAKFEDFGKQCVAANFVNHMAGEKDMTRDEIMPRLQEGKTAFPDQKFEPQLVFVNGRSIMAVILMTGTHEAR